MISEAGGVFFGVWPLVVAHASVDGPTSRGTWAAPKDYIGINFFIKDMKFGGRLLGGGLEKLKGKYEC